LVTIVAAPDLDAFDPGWVFLAIELQTLFECEDVEIDGAAWSLGHGMLLVLVHRSAKPSAEALT
jgi:hypothetical protein